MSKYESAIQQFTSKIDIFWCSPTSSASGGGRLSQGGKEKFVTRLAFRRAKGQKSKRRNLDEPESLPSRIYRTLDGVRRNGKWEGEHQKSPLNSSCSVLSF